MARMPLSRVLAAILGAAPLCAALEPASTPPGGSLPQGHASRLAPREVGLKTRRVASGLNRPVYATHVPGDSGRLFIVEQRGVIRILDLQSLTLLGTAYLNIDALVSGPSSSSDERGLLGLAFHPDYQTNGLFYVHYTNNSSDTVVAEYEVSANPDVADAGSARIVLTIGQPQQNHNGGWIGFGPLDGYLYIASGDGGNFCDTGTGHTSGTGNAQDLTDNLLGKILRIDVAGDPYSIPPSNPFVGVAGDDEIWAYGLRNPWRASFDRATGALYIADVGQGVNEEIDFQPPGSPGGENYGWRCMEGTSCSSVSGCSTTGCTCGSASLSAPVHTYSHALGFSVTGGYAYRGGAMPTLRGTYFFGDFGTARIWSFRIAAGSGVTDLQERTTELSPSEEGFSVGSIASFGEDAAGEIYLVDRAGTTNGEVFQILPE